MCSALWCWSLVQPSCRDRGLQEARPVFSAPQIRASSRLRRSSGLPRYPVAPCGSTNSAPTRLSRSSSATSHFKSSRVGLSNQASQFIVLPCKNRHAAMHAAPQKKEQRQVTESIEFAECARKSIPTLTGGDRVCRCIYLSRSFKPAGHQTLFAPVK